MGYRKLRILELISELQAGQESFRSVTRIFYRGAHCVFLTYDITRDETFSSLVEWLKEIQQHAAEDVKIYLIGNKCESPEDREVQFERAIEFAKQHGIHKCFETSAKSGEMVEDVFTCAGKELFEQNEREKADESKKDDDTITPTTDTIGLNKVKIQGSTKKKKGGCC